MVEEDQAREYLSKLDILNPMGSDGLHPQVLRELADVIVRPPSIIFDQSWQLGEVPENWRKANVTHIFKKSKKENPQNYRLVSLTFIPRKVIKPLPGSSRTKKSSGLISMASPMGAMLGQLDKLL